MKATRRISTLVLMVAGTAVLWGAPPPKVKSLSATAAFTGAPGDAVTTSAPLAGTISSSGIYGVRVTPESLAPVLSVDLGGYIDGTRECASATLARCNVDGPLTGDPPVGVLELRDFSVGVKPLTSGTPDADDLPGGLTGMACGGSAFALVHFTFWLESGDGHWGMNVNPRYHADTARVDRSEDGTSWLVTSPGVVDGRAELVSFAHSNLLRRSGPSHEGQYVLPFSITITAPDASCPAP
jgi:hypothetical protein